jgi:hypothetical protein
MGGMRGLRTDGYASCKLGLPKALPKHMQGPIVELSALHTRKDKRGQLHATALMRIVCDEADAKGKFLFLHCEPAEDSPVDKAKLADFYISFGFEPIQAEPLLMLRPFTGARGIGNA